MNRRDSPVEWLRYKLFLGREALVRRLEKEERQLSPTRRKGYLLLFLLTFGGYSAWCLVSGIQGQGSSTIQVKPLNRPLVQHQQSQKQHQVSQDSIKDFK